LALVFQKPVVFDDDGDAWNGPSADNCHSVDDWAKKVASTCEQSKGKLHFLHFKDGSKLENLSGGQYHPSSCEYSDTDKIDCKSWDAIADGVCEKYCTTGTPGKVTACGNRRLYCENHTSSPVECQLATSCP
jgi:hypothetical protein